jgi:hypothetical protein
MVRREHSGADVTDELAESVVAVPPERLVVEPVVVVEHVRLRDRVYEIQDLRRERTRRRRAFEPWIVKRRFREQPLVHFRLEEVQRRRLCVDEADTRDRLRHLSRANVDLDLRLAGVPASGTTAVVLSVDGENVAQVPARAGEVDDLDVCLEIGRAARARDDLDQATDTAFFRFAEGTQQDDGVRFETVYKFV